MRKILPLQPDNDAVKLSFFFCYKFFRVANPCVGFLIEHRKNDNIKRVQHKNENSSFEFIYKLFCL